MTTLYIPALTPEMAIRKARAFADRAPFYWNSADAAHEAAEAFYPASVVFAVTTHADGTMTAREHLAVPPASDAPELALWRQDDFGEMAAGIAFLAMAVGMIWLIGRATL